MFELLSIRDWRSIATREGPSLLASLWIAEGFYRFHSFTLECGAFLGTWYILGGVQRWLLKVGK